MGNDEANSEGNNSGGNREGNSECNSAHDSTHHSTHDSIDRRADCLGCQDAVGERVATGRASIRAAASRRRHEQLSIAVGSLVFSLTSTIAARVTATTENVRHLIASLTEVFAQTCHLRRLLRRVRQATRWIRAHTKHAPPRDLIGQLLLKTR